MNWTDVGPLAPGSSTLILLNSTAASNISNGTYYNAVSVTGTPPNGDNVSDSDTAEIGVFAPAINIVKTVSPSATDMGGLVTYALNISNTGATNLTLTVVDVLPPYANFGASSIAPTNISNRTITWANITVLALNGYYSINYTVIPLVPDTFANNVTAAGAPPNGNSVNDTDSASFAAGCPSGTR